MTAHGQPTSDAPPVPEASTTDTHNTVQKRADAVRQKVAHIRELESSEPVPVALRTRTQLRSYILERINTYNRENFRAESTILQMLGVLPEGTDYKAMMVDLLTEQIAGYYEPEDATFYVLASDEKDLQDMVLAHELEHAAQDRHWDLQRFLRPSWKQNDVLVARSALAEGDAMLTMLAYMLGEQFSVLSSAMIKNMSVMIDKTTMGSDALVPAFVKSELLSPYIDGLSFVFALYKDGGWAAVDRAFEHPPVSSAQILYPRRYLEGNEPTLVSFELSPGSYGRRVFSNVMGMASMRHLFYQILAGAHAKPVIDEKTSSWSGDRLELWRAEDRDTLVWLSVFETVQGARDEYQLVFDTWPHWIHAPPVCSQGAYGSHCGAVHGQRGVLIERWGDLCLLVITRRDASSAHVSSDRDVHELLQTAEDVFGTLRRTRYPDAWK